jgi:uncharacterized protein (UPF0276 family)
MHQINGAGLGLRQEFLNDLIALQPAPVDFLEIVPENWLERGGRSQKILQKYAQQYSLICHGLSLSIGGMKPLDLNFLQQLKQFFQDYKIKIYSEHLSYCSDQHGFLYDLLPMPFTQEAVYYLAKRIKRVQEILERKIALENVSYYASICNDLSESQFINAVLSEADCLLLLDVNNVYVNSVNHNYNPYEFLRSMPAEKIAYLHIAGHWQKAQDLIIDTHGSEVITPVWDLLQAAYKLFGNIPTLLERDNAVPDLAVLLAEVQQIKFIQNTITEPLYA